MCICVLMSTALPPSHPCRSLAKLLFSFTLGWPLYLFFNVSGRPYDKAWVNHFDPWSPIFRCAELESLWLGVEM